MFLSLWFAAQSPEGDCPFLLVNAVSLPFIWRIKPPPNPSIFTLRLIVKGKDLFSRIFLGMDQEMHDQEP